MTASALDSWQREKPPGMRSYELGPRGSVSLYERAGRGTWRVAELRTVNSAAFAVAQNAVQWRPAHSH